MLLLQPIQNPAHRAASALCNNRKRMLLQHQLRPRTLRGGFPETPGPFFRLRAISGPKGPVCVLWKAQAACRAKDSRQSRLRAKTRITGSAWMTSNFTMPCTIPRRETAGHGSTFYGGQPRVLAGDGGCMWIESNYCGPPL